VSDSGGGGRLTSSADQGQQRRSDRAGGDADRRLLDVALVVAFEAAALVREGARGTVEVADTKTSPTDVVTEVDHAVEALVRRRLGELRPGDGFLGEESGGTASGTGVTWVVDPIDGTVNFLYGLPQYAVSIAAERDGTVVAGVVADVTRGRMFAAVRGGGATLDGEPLQVRQRVPLAERLVSTGFSYRVELRTRQARAAARLLAGVRDLRRLGSAALDLCSVAAGWVDAYVEEGLHPWDMAAGGLIATEAGARLETLPGAGGGTCVVCAPADGYEEFHALVREAGFLDVDA
jgi:myo-inositol-1(or 4)-monophosphatase